MFFDERLSWRWYVVLVIIVAMSFGFGCWMELHWMSNFVNNNIALHVPADYTANSLYHHERILIAFAALTGIIVMVFNDLLRPFTGYYQWNWIYGVCKY